MSFTSNATELAFTFDSTTSELSSASFTDIANALGMTVKTLSTPIALTYNSVSYTIKKYVAFNGTNHGFFILKTSSTQALFFTLRNGSTYHNGGLYLYTLQSRLLLVNAGEYKKVIVSPYATASYDSYYSGRILELVNNPNTGSKDYVVVSFHSNSTPPINIVVNNSSKGSLTPPTTYTVDDITLKENFVNLQALDTSTIFSSYPYDYNKLFAMVSSNINFKTGTIFTLLDRLFLVVESYSSKCPIVYLLD